MDAQEARRITNKALQGPKIEPYVDYLLECIKTAAENGKSEIDPHIKIGELRTPFPNGDEWEAIRKNLEGRGFKWTFHENPDPGHPASRDYTVLSW